MAQEDFLSKLGKVNYKYIYAVMTLLVALPLIFPVNVPQPVADPVKAYAEYLKKIPNGAVIQITFSGYMTMLPDIEPIYMATWKVLRDKDVKLIIFMTHVDSPITIRNEFAKIGWDAKKKEGIDYVIWPYMTITEAAEIAYSADIKHGFFTTDIRGIATDQIPMLQNIKDANDLDLIIGGSVEYNTRRYTIPYSVPQIAWGTATDLLPFVPPFYDPERGPVYGYCGGASQGAMLESYLVSTTGNTLYAGEGVKTNDAKNLGVIGAVAIIVIGNLSMLGGKKKEEK